MAVRLAAAIYISIDLLVVAFLLALSVGISWRALTLGRAQGGQLTTAKRLPALWGMMTLLVSAVIVATSAGIILPNYRALAHSLMWLVVTSNVLGAAGYLFSRSGWARTVWFPVLLALTVCAALVMRGA